MTDAFFLPDDFLAEWGSGILVETDKTKVLFNMGKRYSLICIADTFGLRSA
jgi:hypothetical protein